MFVQDKYLDVVKDCFQANSSMHKALKDAFESFCNKQVGTSTTPELMANFCDTLLRKGGGERLTDDELEATLDKVVKLLVYINDRDMFRCDCGLCTCLQPVCSNSSFDPGFLMGRQLECLPMCLHAASLTAAVRPHSGDVACVRHDTLTSLSTRALYAANSTVRSWHVAC